MTADTRESAFQDDILQDLLDGGWQLGHSSKYDRKRALYPEDCLAYVQKTQPKAWEKFVARHPKDPDTAFLQRLAHQLSKNEPNATDKNLRTFGTLGVLRNPVRDASVSFDLCQFEPEQDRTFNPDLWAKYDANILRVVPELVYSPWTTAEQLQEIGAKAKRWRIDLVLFLNGIPIATLELKSEFKQSVENAIHQYKTTRLPKDPKTNKPEPLLTFKRGALVHFAVSQFEAHMTTKLAGSDTYFLPFNRGTRDGAAGNDVPDDPDTYATGYLWNEVLAPRNILQIVGRFIHLEVKEGEDWQGRKTKKETMIFPRYHQWDLVTRLVNTSREEGPGHRYLVQHSAGSGKSNSIAWTAHQLASLHDAAGEKVFQSVIVVTDRTVLDRQLQDTIYQFEHSDGVVGRIRREEGLGSKSEKLAEALTKKTPIIIVTIQTFPHVLKAIEDDVDLRAGCYAILADEAHSSQTGHTASELKTVLTRGEVEGEPTGEDLLAASVEARQASQSLSYYAFTATPKAKTLELFGRVPNPDEPPSERNTPEAFHVYSMRQAIEEGYILDVLRNYTSYKVAYNLAQRLDSADVEVDSKKARVKLGQWVRLHDYNIAQKVKAAVEHYRKTVMGLLNGHAKAMIVTGSRKEAVRYKLEFDKYVAKHGYPNLRAMVAFSGEVTFGSDDPNAEALVGESFTESNMNPGLKGRDMRKAFDTSEYQVMIVANKFQTGFDQPKLCAMYVDKKLGGVDCVQTLSRLNRKHEGKAETYVLDFVNDPEDILAAFQVYYETAQLLDVSDPNLIWDLFEKLRAAEIFTWREVEQFAELYFTTSKSKASLGNICRPAVERWTVRRTRASAEYEHHRQLFEHAKSIDDPVFMANAEDEMKAAKKVLDALRLFKADLGALARYYEFISQIVDFDSEDLEKLNHYARVLAPMLREHATVDDPVDLSSVELSHYRLSKIRQRHLRLQAGADEGLEPTSDLGTGKARNKDEEWLSQIIQRLNELFITDGLTDADLTSYAHTIRDKIQENATVMQQIANNSPEQALLGDFPNAMDTAVMESGAAHQNQMLQYLNSPEVQAGFRRLVFDMLLASVKGQQRRR